MNEKKAKIVGDVILNLISSLLLTSVLQLAIYPFLAHVNSNHDFGNILTITGICNVIGVMFGISLNNMLLVKYNEYSIDTLKISFTKLAIISLFSAIVLIQFMLFPFIRILNGYNFIFLIIYTVLLLLRSFLTVFYRIELNYILIVKHALYTSVGYLLGLFLFNYYSNWGIIFVSGEVVSLIFLIKTINIKIELNLMREQINKNIRNDFINFFIASSFSNMMLYLDRLLINPILGASQVAVFFSASVIGKLLSLVMQPFSSVMLSYLSKEKSENAYNLFKKSLIVSIISGILFFIISYFVTPILLKVLYSDLYKKGLEIYILCNILAIVNNISIILQPLTLKFCPMKWQSIIQIIYFICYFLMSFLLMKLFGLKGFVIGNILASIIKFLIIILIMTKYTKNNARKEKI